MTPCELCGAGAEDECLDSCDSRQHQSIYEGGHTAWRRGFTCDECEGYKLAAELRKKPSGFDAELNPIFIGRFTQNPRVQEFLETGDPTVMRRGQRPD